jgi:hypothetical protein
MEASTEPQFGFQPDGAYLTPYQTTYFHRGEFFQRAVGALLDRPQMIEMPGVVDWAGLADCVKWVTPFVVIVDDGVQLDALGGFRARGFQRVVIYSDADYAGQYVQLVERDPALAKIVHVATRDMFYSAFVMSGSSFVVLLADDLLRTKYGRREDDTERDMEDSANFMYGLKFGVSEDEAIRKFGELAGMGYKIGDARQAMIIRGATLRDSMHYFAEQLAVTAARKGELLIVWINAFLLRTLRAELREHLVAHATASGVAPARAAVCLHFVGRKIAVTAFSLGGVIAPPAGVNVSAVGADIDAVMTRDELLAWFPAIGAVTILEKIDEE